MTRKKQPSPLSVALLEMAGDMNKVGVMNTAAHEKITLRLLGHEVDTGANPLSGDEIKSLRENAHLSQAVFARFLNLTTGYVSQLERGVKHATGPVLVLLNLIRRKGFCTLL